jgi:hypothetical protein
MEDHLTWAAYGVDSGKSNSELVVIRGIMATVNISAMMYILATVFICQRKVSDKKKTNSEIF